MKKYKTLVITSLTFIFIGCGDKNNSKNLFSIDESKFKSMFHNSDTINLTLKNEANKTIDSVTYYNNDTKIGTAKGNSSFNFSLINQKIGYQNLKAVAHFEGLKEENSTRIEMLSSIEPKILTYKLLNTYPHNIDSFTEGLEFYGDYLYESTGQKGSSYFVKTDHKTGKTLQKTILDSKYFGEGITFINGKMYQLTWQEATGFIYDANTLKLEKTFQFDKNIEGWGMTNDKKYIYQSDGTEKIWKMNPENQKMISFINVYTNTSKIKKINELEWIDQKIYANIWEKDAIIIINPLTGAVEALVDLSGLRKLAKVSDADTLNGIAYNPRTKTIFVTGKNWDKMFEIKIDYSH
ncbi:glutamine cyclotransferase [Flavobacterium psychrophilum]|uniref:Glutamine cyclotransferase n=5 Tax=Flavobacterium psychrophilum TaxID=96345 RepID=A6GYH2_FLAPJ|nr:glutaminyl-peptide cyclotransferase [Flavobacterium psychrophilum]AIG29861.1 glutamine cyclotransferase [Flavobacterium psychrophilum]AIG32138.1 glutamine cyclotransferase [Flavobacterium psychrophilum]AIG34293.1 glutamine cyclotransferase [Flavobacterium psychrophilum]AIG36656.1 glutamine cyclotransferase [Flavobacterium psychrophilum]AIG38921.1 glutamine cyclotransferase [Flavobacterium psychrophilum]